ncbi:MAG TPA: hypothetical protein VM555_06965 [Tahibacter sp.]|nr:hypothetical protein [Tahibacter sp.]
MRTWISAPATIALLLLCQSGVATAQCFYAAPLQPWPDSLVFDPPHPAAGTPFAALIGGPALYALDSSTQALSGSTLVVDAIAQDTGGIGVPPPRTLLRIPLEALPNGTYAVQVRLRVDNTDIGLGISDCAPIAASVVVGTGIADTPIPSLGVASLALTATTLALFGGYALRRRRRNAY